jgi:CRP-like cAMP-binding protein
MQMGQEHKVIVNGS